MANIVVIYHSRTDKPLRGSVREHLYAFQKFGGHRTYYVNLAARRIPSFLFHEPVDMVVFTTTLLSFRWGGTMPQLLRRHDAALRRLPGVKIALPQDEFLHTDELVRIINDYDVRHVFSVAPPSEWPLIYQGVDFGRVQFHHVLTGYLDEETLGRIDRLSPSAGERTIDVGYRAYEARPWLGRHGMLKKQIADVVGPAATKAGLRCDISLREQDTLLGDDWLRFLLRCRYVIGVEGGASILDRDGSIRENVEAYLAAHPRASFAEVEQACFPGKEGELKLFALSPRHLENCATRTGQVLIEGAYNGVLEPGRHYIPLRADFGNLDDVIRQMRDETLRQEMVERAYADVVQSGQYTYRAFVDFVVSRVLRSSTSPEPGLRWKAGGLADRMSYKKVALAVKARRTAERIVPRAAWSAARALKRRLARA